MSKTTQDPTKYYRTGVAIPLARKEVLDERLVALGLKTLGDLTTMFILAPGVVEALLPVARAFKEEQGRIETKAEITRREKLLGQLKGLSPKEMAAILKAVGVSAAVEDKP